MYKDVSYNHNLTYISPHERYSKSIWHHLDQVDVCDKLLLISITLPCHSWI